MAASASPFPDLAAVIVPTHNRPALLRRTLDSLRAQTLREFEVAVVNDGGVSVADVVREYDDLDITYVEHPQVRGLAAARNTGLARSRARWVCYLDDDDTFAPTHLARTVGALRAGVSQVVHSDCCLVFERRFDDGSVVFEEEREIPILDVTPAVHFTSNPTAVCLVVHDRACLEKTGTFDETLPVVEDYDLWLRFQVAGFRFHRVAGATARVHADLNAGQMTAERIHQFPGTLQLLYSRYAEHARHLPGVEDGQLRHVRWHAWRARLVEAFLRASGGAKTLDLELGAVLYFRGFASELGNILNDANWGPQAMPTAAAPARPAAAGAPAGPYGKKWLLRQLAKEIIAHPLPGFLRRQRPASSGGR